jgi:2-aminoethylphosphonate-pyruvate transaminase
MGARKAVTEGAEAAPALGVGRSPAVSPTGDPWLLTPGPLTTSPAVKQAMLHDYGSRDPGFVDVNRRIRERLTAIVHGRDAHVCVPLQGSGTFAVEAMLGTLVPAAGGRVLILVNGAYGRRMALICRYAGRSFATLEWPEETPVDTEAVEQALARDASITHVAVVHCETTSGVLNPVGQLAELVARQRRALLVDAMSSFGALPLDLRTVPLEAIAASANKCLEAIPGVGFCLARRVALEAAAGNAHALSLDLHSQWVAMERDGQWRFTPPTHAILALDRALDELDAEGGVAGRGARYAENCRILVQGMRELGFETLLPDTVQAPIIVTFRMPTDTNFVFAAFYEGMRAKGYVIYPGKLTAAESFRIGCIGRIGPEEIRGAVAAVRTTLAEMGVQSCAAASGPAPGLTAHNGGRAPRAHV